MLSSVARPTRLHSRSLDQRRSTSLGTLHALISVLSALPEVLAEAQEMKRKAKQRYPYLILDS
jgi:hypothetical protein